MQFEQITETVWPEPSCVKERVFLALYTIDAGLYSFSYKRAMYQSLHFLEIPVEFPKFVSDSYIGRHQDAIGTSLMEMVNVAQCCSGNFSSMHWPWVEELDEPVVLPGLFLGRYRAVPERISEQTFKRLGDLGTSFEALSPVKPILYSLSSQFGVRTMGWFESILGWLAWFFQSQEDPKNWTLLFAEY